MTSILGQNEKQKKTKTNKKKFEQPESFSLVLLKAAIVTGGTKTGLQGKGHESVSIQSTGYSLA